MRVVCTGHGPTGESQIRSDSEVAPVVFPGTGVLVPLWSADRPAEYPDRGDNPQAKGFFPPLGGVRTSLIRVDPVDEARQVGGDIDSVASGLAESMEDAESGVHRTDTTDFVYVVDGSITLTVGADRVVLLAGDIVVQNGTSHSWRNESDERPATLLVFMIGASRAAADDR
jgi:mannose-6-phosphate isomerase-like protein (cupin superfamily)